MKIRIRGEWPIYISFFLLVLSLNKLIAGIGIATYFEYTGLMFILFGIFFNLNNYKKTKDLVLFIVIMVLFSIGLLNQDLPIVKIAQLIVSLFILSSFAIFPCNFLDSKKVCSGIKKAIVCALAVSALLALFTGRAIITHASEGLIVNYGFDAGIKHRNYYSYIVLCLIFLNDIQYINEKKNKTNFIAYLFLLLISNSRSSFIVLLIYEIFRYTYMFREAKKNTKLFVFFSAVMMVCVGIPIFILLQHSSETFFFRTNGLYNYLKMFGHSYKHLLFGNAQMAFRNTGMTYDENIRSVIGWNGSTELVILNVLIKNGLLGFVAYIFIFARFIRKAGRIKDMSIRLTIYAITISFIVSAFVESYLADINQVYSVCMYILLCALTSEEFVF